MAQMELLVPGYPIEVPDDLGNFFGVIADAFNSAYPINRTTVFNSREKYFNLMGDAEGLEFPIGLAVVHDVSIPRIAQPAKDVANFSVRSATSSLHTNWSLPQRLEQDAKIAFAESHVIGESRENAKPPLDVWCLYMKLVNNHPRVMPQLTWLALTSSNQFAGEYISWPAVSLGGGGKPPESVPIPRESAELTTVARTIAGILIPSALVPA